MYSLDTIEIQGLGVFQSLQKVKFPPGLTFLVGKNLDSGGLFGSNGCGKTTVANAISWALYNNCPAGKGSALQNHSSPSTTVTLTLKGEDQDLVITRKCKGARHEVVLDILSRTNPERISGDVAMVQDRINKLVGCDWSLFNSVLYFRGVDDTAQFLRMPPAKRATVLSNLVDDQYFQVGAQILKLRTKELENLQGVYGMELLTTRSQVNILEEDLEKAQRAASNWEAQEKERVAEASARFHFLTSQLTQVSQALLEARQFCQENKMADLGGRHLEAASAVKKLEGDKRVLESDISRLSSREYLEQCRDVCPTCGQAITAFTLQAQDERKRNLQNDLSLIQTQLRAAQEHLQNVSSTLSRVQDNTQQVRKLEEQADTLHQTAVLQRDQMLTRKSDYLDTQITALRERRAASQFRIAELESKLVDTSTQIDLHKKVGTAFSGEVRNLMFDLIRGPLEEWTHHYVEKLIDTGLSVQFPHQDCREKFEILVWNGPHAQDLSSYSGGELWRITIAILLAFRKVLSGQANCKLNFLLLDDFAGELDNEGVAKALQVLEQLTHEEVGTILMTIPREEFLPAGRYNKLVVTKKGGQASVTAT